MNSKANGATAAVRWAMLSMGERRCLRAAAVLYLWWSRMRWCFLDAKWLVYSWSSCMRRWYLHASLVPVRVMVPVCVTGPCTRDGSCVRHGSLSASVVPVGVTGS